MATITSQFAVAAKAKAHMLTPERQPSMKQIAADAAEVVALAWASCKMALLPCHGMTCLICPNWALDVLCCAVQSCTGATW